MPASMQRSMCSSTICRAMSPTFLKPTPCSTRPAAREALLREPERRAVLVEEVLLLEAEPGVGVVADRGAAVRRMRRAVGQQHLAHDEVGAVARGVGEERDRLQEAVRVRAVGLAGGAAVEVPQRQLLDRRLRVEVDDLRLAA
jgi:hypothetical protein